MTTPISVEAPSEAAAQQLAASLRASFPLEVTQADGHWLVVVTPGRSPEHDVVGLLGEVERWLVAADVTATRVHLDGHVYGMERPGLAEASRD
jgi:hypothetical protein